jgi:uncharacterized protein
MNSKKKRILFWIKITIILYCLVGIAFYYLQDKLLLHPKQLETDHPFHFDQHFEEVFIPINKTDTINIVKFLPGDPVRKGVVIYFHGNKENVEYYAKYARNFTSRGYELWMPDYPGFGKSRGQFEEKKMYKLAYQVLKLAENKFSEDSIIIYGKSLGTGIAAYAATLTGVRALVLETPYYDIPSVFRTYAFLYPVKAMSNYEFPVWKFIQESESPVVIFHGKEDWITSYSNAKKLMPLLKKGDKFISFSGGDHHNLEEFGEYKSYLDSLLR